MTCGYVTFALGEREFAAPLDDVREVVRLSKLATVPGMRPPLAGLLDLRGTPLPVLDVRGETDRAGGDVLVVDDGAGGRVGVAVDMVHTVLRGEEVGEPVPAPPALPPYVVEVRRAATGAVLLVDLRVMAGLTAGGHT